MSNFVPEKMQQPPTAYSDILTENMQNYVMQLANDIEANERGIGELAVELCAAYVPRGVSYTFVTESIAAYSEGKISGNTVRDIEYIYRETPNIIWREFYYLGRHHFKAVIKKSRDESGEVSADKMRDLLTQWQKESPSLTVPSLRAWINPNKDPLHVKLMRRLIKLLDKLLESDAPPAWKTFSAMCKERANRYLEE